MPSPAAPPEDPVRRDLRLRILEPELMDDPGLDPADHHAALRALSRVHRLSGTGVRLGRMLDRVAESRPASQPLRILDVACGGGDVGLDAARWARRRNRAVEITGFDLSERALAYAASRTRSGARSEGADDGRVTWVWLQGDAVRGLPDAAFDLVVSSLFLHHLETPVAVEALRAMVERGRGLLVEDLSRSRLGLFLAHFTLRAVSRSRVAHVDGPLSVRAGWTGEEFRALAEAAGVDRSRVRAGWPERWIVEVGP